MIIKAYMLAAKKAAKQRQITGKYIVRSCFKQMKANSAMVRDKTTGALQPVPVKVLDMVYRL
jgi:hypothetical protein